MGTYTAGDLGSTCCPCYFAITQPLGALPWVRPVLAHSQAEAPRVSDASCLLL